MAGDTVLAFDAYGTLLSTESIASKLAELLGSEAAAQVAGKWRVYQLEYTWRLNSMGKYEPFSSITRKSLRHTLAELKLSLSDAQVEDVMTAYDTLGIFPDVAPAVKAIKNASGIHAVVFSNGTQHMVSSSVHNSPELGPHAAAFKDIVVVEEVQAFKPSPKTYEYLARRVGKDKSQMGDMWLISGNPFDVVGARACGLKAAWVDRAGNGWSDQLGDEPTVIIRSLEDLLEAVKKHS